MNYSAKALEAINDWEKSTGAYYIGGPFFARDFGDDLGLVIFEIKNWAEGIALSLIKTPPEYRGKGLASRALKELTSFADKHGVPVTGSVEPQEDPEPVEGKPPLNKGQLKKWYGRHGFKHKPGDRIYRSPAKTIVDALLEADEIDPKAFVDRTNTVNLDKLRALIYEKSPTLGLITFHLLRRWNNPPRTAWELNVLLAQEPVSDNGFDPRHTVGMDVQRNTIEAVKEFLAAHGLTLTEITHRICSSTYRNVCRVARIVFDIDTDDGVDFIGHDNEMSG